MVTGGSSPTAIFTCLSCLYHISYTPWPHPSSRAVNIHLTIHLGWLVDAFRCAGAMMCVLVIAAVAKICCEIVTMVAVEMVDIHGG